MTMTFIIVYVVIALILVGLVNLFMSKRKRKMKTQRTEQTLSENDTSHQSYQSKFNIRDTDETSEANDANAISEENGKLNISNNSDETEALTSDQNAVTQHEESHTQEAEINEKLKQKHSAFMFGKGTSQGKVLIAMIFGMFIAILNQTLLNVALPKINTDFNISANTGQWLMTGFMLVMVF